MKIFGWVLFAVLIVPTCARGQVEGTIGGRPAHRWIKSENGLLLFFNRREARDAASSEVQVFGKHGEPVVSFALLPLVSGAETVQTEDVSAVPGKRIAVYAAYAKADGSVAYVLLYFDFNGSLLRAFAVDPTRDIDALALDDSLNVWTVTAAGGQDPSRAPMVVEYSDTGSVVKQLLPRSEFPKDAKMTEQSSQIGALAAGYNSGTFWFWLPASAELVTIRTSDSAVTRTPLSLPPPPSDGRSWPQTLSREASGDVVLSMGETTEPHTVQYIWSQKTRTWSEFEPTSCQGDWLLGADGNQEIYVDLRGSNEVCAVRNQ
ncbi:MAG TPA: hypothetical protein VKS20_09635 [Candidatus Acidoferrales bacterium]|nr:hypothetical protein [Candidatus Acidoferrales bacterium]